MLRRHITLISVLACLGILLGLGYIYYKHTYPFGQSHCCIKNMYFALERYADENGGRYPAGQSSAEASLSLLYKSNFMDAHTLRGMTVSEETTRKILEGGGLLGPDTCGWHYVPGLTKADDPEIAILWCKHALGHFGERTKNGGREVVFVGSGTEWISGDKWPAFLEKQKQLIQNRSARAIAGEPLYSAIIELPDGTHLDKVDGYCTVKEVSKGSTSSGSGTSSGVGCDLRYFRPPIQDGTVTRTLSFSNLESAPVTLTFRNGIPNTNGFVFKMRHIEMKSSRKRYKFHSDFTKSSTSSGTAGCPIALFAIISTNAIFIG
jgi:hypothetical protein